MTDWRGISRNTILSAIEDGKRDGLEGKALKRFVSEHYPFGPRQYHPYKIWLSEMKQHFTPPGPKQPAKKLEMNRSNDWQQLPLGVEG